jgi:integrase/recombinase XerD
LVQDARGALLGACLSARDRLIVLLMARAGLRRGEMSR